MIKETYKKVLLLGLALLIIAGILIIMLKGFNVNMMYKQHEEVVFNISSSFNMDDVKSICNEVFSNKKYQVRKIEKFQEAFAINVSNITDDEKTKLVEKINEKYGKEFKVDELEINTISNVRIRDWFTPYIIPTTIAMVITLVYAMFRLKDNHPLISILKLIALIILTTLALGSGIAIARIPVMPAIIPGVLSIILLEICIFISKNANK